MKLSYLRFVVLFATILTITLNCTKGSNDQVADNCIVTKWYSQGDTSQTSIRFTYDNQNRIIFWDGPGPSDNTITYETNKITIRGVAPNTNSYIVYYLRSDSLANSSAQYINGSLLDTTLYFYDIDKYLVKSVRYTSAFGKDSVMMNYSNGNLDKITIYTSNGLASQATFQYYPDSSKLWAYQNIGPFNNNGLYYPWLGRTNKNLIKSYSSEFNGNPSPVTISYTLNGNKYVEKYSMTYMGNTDQHFFEYHCQ